MRKRGGGLRQPSPPILIVDASSYHVTATRSKAVAKILIKEFIAERIVIINSIKGKNYRGRLLEEATAFKVETVQERSVPLPTPTPVTPPQCGPSRSPSTTTLPSAGPNPTPAPGIQSPTSTVAPPPSSSTTKASTTLSHPTSLTSPSSPAWRSITTSSQAPPLSNLTALLLHSNLFIAVPATLFSSLTSLQYVYLDNNPFNLNDIVCSWMDHLNKVWSE